MYKRLSLKDLPEEDRPREKLIRKGERSLSDAELLAIVLGAGSRTESALQLSQRILHESGGLENLSEMSVPELCRKFHGIGPARASQLKASLELSRRHLRTSTGSHPRLNHSIAVFEHFQQQFHKKRQEEFWVVALDAKNKLIDSALVSRGTLMGSLVHPREVFLIAIRSAAAGIIVLHNHPSGEPEPSAEDRKVTHQISESGKLLGIPLLDHIIIGSGCYFSFKDAGYL